MRAATIALLLCCCAADGVDGRDGADGEDGEDGSDGDAGPQGEQGERGERGAQGLMGAQGMTGRDGAQGLPGDNGTSGGGYRPSFWFHCERDVDLISSGAAGQDGIRETVLVIEATRYNNGDTETRCRSAIGAVESSAGGFYFPAAVNGALIAGCVMDLDMPPIGDGVLGRWALGAPAGALIAEYADHASHALNNTVITYAENDCRALAMDAAGTWTPAMLADAF